MSRRPRLLLLDAGAVFAAMHHGAWDALVGAYEILIPSTVIHTEAIFFVDHDGARHEIDLAVEGRAGRIQEIAVEAQEIAQTARRFSPEFRERLDAGELEAIAYLVATSEPELRFVSGDGPAIQAVAMLDADTRVMSLEEALDRCGWSKPVASQYRREFVEEHRAEGSIRRIQGRGLV